MQTSVQVRVLSGVVLAVGCTAFEARNYDAPVPPHGAGGGAGYSYQAGRAGAGSAAVLPAPRDRADDSGPAGGAAAALGEGGNGGSEHDPVAQHGAAAGGARHGDGAPATDAGDGGQGGVDVEEAGHGNVDGRAGRAAGGVSAGGRGGVSAGGRAGTANGAGRAGSAGEGDWAGRSGDSAGAGGHAGTQLGAAGGAAGSVSDGGTAGHGGTPPAVLFSEYVEGSSRYKALELRALAPSVVLDGCRIATYSNGGSSAKSVALSGTLAVDATFVVCSPELLELLGSVCTLSASLSFNGNDAIALECDGATLDVIGQVGVDPGDAWTSGDVSTANQTLRRRCSVTHADADDTDPFDAALDWAAFPTDDFSGLGVPDCG